MARPAASPPASTGDLRRGFSVLEVLVASSILLLALLLAARLLEDVGMQMAWSGRRALELSPSLALEQIRTDLRGSYGAPTGLGLWLPAPLAIDGSASGYAIVYLVDQGRLVRRTTDPDGREEERVVLDRVVDLRYRDNWGAIEVEIEYLRMRPPTRRDSAAGMKESGPPDHQRMSILISPRRQSVERF